MFYLSFFVQLFNFKQLCCAAALVINHVLIAVVGFLPSQAEEKAKCELLGSSGPPRVLQEPEGELWAPPLIYHNMAFRRVNLSFNYICRWD